MPENKKDLKTFLLKVEPKDAGLRVDVYLSGYLGITRSRIKGLIEDLNVKLFYKDKWVDVKPSYKVRAGDEISVILPEERKLSLIPQDIAIEILYRDEDLVVINKPPGIPVYPGPGHPDRTVLNGLLYHLGKLCDIGGPLRPGVVHRLDRDTSGVMIFAFSEKAYYGLVDIFKNRRLRRRYICLACGEFKENHGEIRLPIGRAISDRKKISTKTKAPKDAITEWRVLERLQGATLLEVYLQTGRTHQIRVHLASQGHPVCGDRLYGRKTFIELRGKKTRFPRQMLHAETISFNHPLKNVQIKFVAPIPDDMRKAIEELKNLNP